MSCRSRACWVRMLCWACGHKGRSGATVPGRPAAWGLFSGPFPTCPKHHISLESAPPPPTDTGSVGNGHLQLWGTGNGAAHLQHPGFPLPTGDVLVEGGLCPHAPKTPTTHLAHWELRAEATNKRGKNGPQTKAGDQLTGQASSVTAGVLSASRVPRRGCGRA